MTATQNQSRQQNNQQPNGGGKSLLEQVLDQEVGPRIIEMRAALDSRIDKVRELLPTHLKDEAERLCKRALFTFSRKKELQECTPASFVRCVLEAAEMGLAIDGRLCHAVPYNCGVNKDKRTGKYERWEQVAQCIPDYKGLIAIARRSGQVENIKADIVCKNDTFTHGRAGPISRLEHSYPLGQERGDVIGAYAVISFADDTPWVYELMDIADLNHIQNKSKAKDSGPWQTDTQEMRKKTVVRRALKTYCDDPGLIRAFEIDDAEIDGIRVSAASGDGKRVHRSSLNESLSVPTATAKPVSQFAEPTRPNTPAEDNDQNFNDEGEYTGEAEGQQPQSEADENRQLEMLDQLEQDLDGYTEAGEVKARCAAAIKDGLSATHVGVREKAKLDSLGGKGKNKGQRELV